MEYPRLCLVVQVIEVDSLPIRRVGFCDVQVWRGQECLTTYRLVDMQPITYPEGASPGCVEQWASMMTRKLARIVEDNAYSAIQAGTVHTFADIDARFPLSSSQH